MADDRELHRPSLNLNRQGWLNTLFSAVVRSAQRPPDGYSYALIGALIMAAAALLLLPGGYFVNWALHDEFMLLDGVYRLSWGQTPHVDFSTAFGPLTFALAALTVTLGFSLAQSLLAAQLLFLLLLLPAVLYLAHTRLSSASALLFSALVILLCLAPVPPVDGDAATLSLAMFYNRLGWAAVTTLFLFWAPLRGAPARRRWLWDGLLIGMLCALLFYLKISYTLAALLFLPLWTFGTVRGWHSLAAAAALCAVTLVATELWQGFHLAYLDDVLQTLAVSTGRDQSLVATLRWIIINNSAALFFAAATPLLLLYLCRRLNLADVLFVVVVLLAAVLITAFNSQRSGLLLLAVPLFVAYQRVILAGQSEVRGSDNGSFVPPLVASTAALTALLVVTAGPLTQYAVGLKLHADRVITGVGMPGLAAVASLRVADDGSNGSGSVSALADGLPGEDFLQRVRGASAVREQQLYESEYLLTVRDGVRALGRCGDAASGSVQTLDFANPFPLLLGRQPARGGPLLWVYGYTFSEHVRQDPAELFADIDVVMVPRVPAVPKTFAKLKFLYWPYLQTHYRSVCSSRFWQLYRRAGVVLQELDRTRARA